MDFEYNRTIRIISIIVLSFFLWTFGGVFEVAFAFKNSDKLRVTSDEKKARTTQKPEEKFQKAIEDIENILTDTITDTDTKKNKLRIKKTEIETLDVDIKKQFQETEKKLITGGLPLEILQRHYNFVRHYEDNLSELKGNLDAIDRAATKGEADSAIEKAKAHLEKVKPPKKHVPLDPNKLPHRTAEPVEAPLVERSVEVQKSGSAEAKKQQAAPSTSSVPTSADLSETIEVQFTPEIKAKAQELGYNPVKIYNWVRNNIEYVPTYGSIQGANMCLQTKLCNDFDTASLLIALLRASNIHARYVYGTIEVPIEKVKNWVGGFTDSMAAINLLASAGIPTKGMIVGGEVKYARMEHVWVEAYIDYIPSRGARHKIGDTWIPLDASFKQYNYTQGIDIKSAVPFDAQSFIDQIKATATINEEQGYVTNVNSLLIQQNMQDYQTRVKNYISQNYPNATVGDVLGKKEIVKQEFPIILGTLPYNDIAAGWKNSSLPDSLRHKITFNVTKDMYDEYIGTPINITRSLPELAGKKITLSYSPATQADEDVINSYLPKPHPDGTPIDPSELPTSLPAYLINVKPELRVDGQVIATGSTIGLGVNETFTMTFSGPGANASDVITNEVKAGNYLAIALDLGRISQEQMTALKTKLEATKAKLEAQNYTGLTKDDILGDILYTTALSYHAELGVMNQVTAKTMGVVAITYPSETIFSFEIKSNYYFGIPVSVSPGGLAMDADRLITLVKALDGNKDKPIQFMLNSGANGSALEHAVPEQLFSTTENPAEGISAVKALKIANGQGIPIYSINQSNVNAILPQLQIDGDVKADIQNAVSAGKQVTVSKTNINFNGWIGCGYIIIDPNKGDGAYMISGGMNGAFIYFLWFVGLIILIILATAGMAAIVTLIVLAIPAIISAIGAMIAAINGLLLSLAALYNQFSIWLSSFGGIRALYELQMMWANMSPPPLPFPTDPFGVLLYLVFYFRFFLLWEYTKLVNVIYEKVLYSFDCFSFPIEVG